MRNCLGILLGIAAVLVLAELLLWALPVATGLAYQPSSSASPIVHGKPGHDYTYSVGWNFRLVRHGHLNNFGFPANADYDPAQPNVLLIGDSYVESLMLNPEERLQSLLQEQLHGTLSIYGLGRSGSSLAQKLGVARWAVPVFHPQAVVINLSENDVAESRAGMPGDFFLQTAAGDCRLNRTDRPPDGVILRLAKETALYHYLYDNLKLSVTIADLFARHNAREDQSRGGSGSIDTAPQCLLRLIPQLIGLAPEHVFFVVGADLTSIYSNRPSRPLDVDSFADLLESRGYGVVRAEPLFRKDYRSFRLPLSFRPTDDHWNARAQRLVAVELARRIDATQIALGQR